MLQVRRFRSALLARTVSPGSCGLAMCGASMTSRIKPVSAPRAATMEDLQISFRLPEHAARSPLAVRGCDAHERGLWLLPDCVIHDDVHLCLG